MITTVVYETYWRFAAERLAMFYRRLRGEPAPWTDDPILRAHRFTNSYRAADRVSQYLIGEVQYRPDRPTAPREVFFRTLLFKIFNRIDTWEALEAALGPLELTRVGFEKIDEVLHRLLARGRKIYSPAYIMPAPPFGHLRKHSNHLALLARMLEDRLPDRLRQAPSLERAYELVLAYPGLGRFLAFQYTIDLNYSELLDFPESDFVVAGPGALDGIAKCFADRSGKTAEDVIRWVCERQEQEFAARGLDFEGLFGRPLQLIDCQNLFCEISKYARVAHPDMLGASGRTRIKQSYRLDPTPLPALAFPRRWGLVVPEPQLTPGLPLQGQLAL
ncbi:MAG: nucleotide kinase domain-containing protein [Pseudomonadota bacterium]